MSLQRRYKSNVLEKGVKTAVSTHDVADTEVAIFTAYVSVDSYDIAAGLRDGGPRE